MDKKIVQICEKVRLILFEPDSRTAGDDNNEGTPSTPIRNPIRPEIEKLILALKNNLLTKIQARCKIFGLEHALLTTFLAPQAFVDAATTNSQKILVHVVWCQILQNDKFSKDQSTKVLTKNCDPRDVAEIVDDLEQLRKLLGKDGFFTSTDDARKIFRNHESKAQNRPDSVKQIVHKLIEKQYCDVKLALIKIGITNFASDRFFGFDNHDTFVLEQAEKFIQKGEKAQAAAKCFYDIAKLLPSGRSRGTLCSWRCSSALSWMEV